MSSRGAQSLASWCSCALVVVILCAASYAAAQASDTVFLPGGGRLRGTVEVYEPGRRVVVLLPDGTRRRLARGEFDRVVFGDAPDSPETPSDVAPDPAPPIASPAIEVAPPVEPTAPIEPASPEATPLIIEVPPPEGTAPLDTPDAGASPPAAVQTLEATAAPTAMPARAFGDQQAATLAWPEEDPGRIMRPRGMFHVGAQVLATVRLPIGDQRNTTYGVEVAPYVDLRLALPVHLRALLVIAGLADDGGEQENTWSEPRSTSIRGYGVFELAGRVLLGLLVSDDFAIRVGGQIGFEVLSHVERTALYGDGVLELAIRVLDGRFEVLLSGTGGLRTRSAVQISSRGISEYGGANIIMGVNLGLGYVFY